MSLQPDSQAMHRMNMPIELEVIVGKVGNSLRITIPRPITDKLKIKEGDVLALSLTDGEILIRKVTD